MTKHLTHIITTSIVVACIALPVSALAASGSHTANRSSQATVTTPRCSSSQLRVSRVDVQGAAGTTYWDLSLRNVGRTACHMIGYPGVGLLDPNARLINVNVARVPGWPIRSITVAPGRNAYFSFGYPSNAGACSRHFSAFGIQIIPPNDYRRIVLPERRFAVCTPSRAVANPRVFPVRPSLRLGS
jgi:Protein of unknown function (DUF4232)